MGLAREDKISRPFDNVAQRVLVQVLDEERGPGSRLEGDARVDRRSIHNGDPGEAADVPHTDTARLECRVEQGNGAAAIDEHAHAVLVKVDGLEKCLLVAGMHNTILEFEGIKRSSLRRRGEKKKKRKKKQGRIGSSYLPSLDTDIGKAKG